MLSFPYELFSFGNDFLNGLVIRNVHKVASTGIIIINSLSIVLVKKAMDMKVSFHSKVIYC